MLPHEIGQIATARAEDRLYQRIAWRLVPLLFACYVVNYLDRINISFAKLQMENELQWGDQVYGLGMSIFFLGYFFFEVPSNILLHKFGARKWVSRIMVTWGFVSMAMIFVKSPAVFYLLRFSLGLAEAGFFPGIILYLTYWFPSGRRARISALFLTAISFSGVIGGPLSGWIMSSMDEVQGWKGWQWLFLIEGLPALVLGVVVFCFLDDSIRSARWLTEEEKALLEGNIQESSQQTHDFPVIQALVHSRVWLLSVIYFSFVMGLYGIGFWLPQIIAHAGILNIFHVGLLSAIPYGVATVAMLVVGWNSDRLKERRWHLILSAWAGALGILLTACFSTQAFPVMAALTLATAGILSLIPVFWTLPAEFLGGTAAAAGIGLINSLGNLAGFASPYIMGTLLEKTHAMAIGLCLDAAFMMLGSFLVYIATRPSALGRRSENVPRGIPQLSREI